MKPIAKGEGWKLELIKGKEYSCGDWLDVYVKCKSRRGAYEKVGVFANDLKPAYYENVRQGVRMTPAEVYALAEAVKAAEEILK